jgi:hypothetical protein
MVRFAWVFVILLAVAARAAAGADALRALALDLHLQQEGGRATCGFPLALWLTEARRTGNPAFGADAAALLTRPVTQTSTESAHFRIHYDTSGTQAAAMLDAGHQPIPGTAHEYATWVAALAESAYAVETAQLGYPAAPADLGQGGGDEYDIYVSNLDTIRVYGITFPENPIGTRRSTTYMVVDNDFSFVLPDSNRGLPALAVTLAHEYHHAIQLGNYGDWGFDNIWFYEMTSVWMEDVVFPDVNDYYAYLRESSGHFRHPETPLTAPEVIVYSRGIWCKYLAGRFSPDVIRSTWQGILSVRPLEALDAALQASPYNTSLRSAFVEWTLWNYYTGSRAVPGQYYPDAAVFPQVTAETFGFTPPARTIDNRLGPLACRYTQVLYHADTLTLIPANVDDAAARAGDLSTLPYSYLLNVERPDGSYDPTDAGVYVKLATETPSNWYSWTLFNAGIEPADVGEGRPFPNPFIPGAGAGLAIPVASTAPVSGSLAVYDASMNLVYQAEMPATLLLGNYVFTWDGRTENGETAATGVYLFVIDIPDHRYTGKFAIIRK